MKIVLGSQSQGRKQVLSEMGYDFEVLSAGIDEKAIRFDDAQQLTLALANAKADALLTKLQQPCVLITSDQVVVCHGQILEKPESPEEARDFLHGYATHPLQTVTAVVVLNTATNQRVQGVDIATVWLKPYPEALIDQMIAEGNVFSWAGGFGIQEAFNQGLVEKMEGAIDSVIGLPKDLTTRLLHQVQSI